ncbi:hypothetical protein [Paenibacillus sp. NPDC058174]|uniref:hypothetical protein n=1 Tax=Paenibacillus sp. NPDC058174 TaxID=3346366 RepID=UPI0036D797EB
MYQEKEKNIIRSEALSSAISILTEDRKQSTITTLDYFDSLRDFMLFSSSYSSDHILARNLKKSTEQSWKKHFESALGNKRPSELKVAYLAGPNPENDLMELIKQGILPENIWAFESDNDIYKEAVGRLEINFPQVKIHLGKISSFFSNSAINFDIVYLDFCGALVSPSKRNRNISNIVSLIDNHRLNSPGVIITNFAYIDESNDPGTKKLLAKIVSLYLYPKAYADNGASAEEQGLLFHEWFYKVNNNLEYYYSEFIRRFMMDISSVVIPFIRICRSQEYFEMFFELDKKQMKLCKKILFSYDDQKDYIEELSFKLEGDSGGYLESDMSFFSIPWFLRMAQYKNIEELYDWCDDEDERERLKLFYMDFYDDQFNKASRSLINQMSFNSEELLDQFSVMLYLILGGSHGIECYSEKLKNVYNMDWQRVAPQACDVFTFQSVIGLLIGQLSVPYHINVLKSVGWSYKAKETVMYTDMFVLDECRYIYDMLPTIDMINNRIENLSSQMCYRFALDALDKNHIRYNTELFFGCAVVGCNNEGFEDRWFKERYKIEV